MSRPIKQSPTRLQRDSSAHRLGTSYRSQHGEQSITSIAEESIARDLADDEIEQAVSEYEGLNRTVSRESAFGEHSLVGTSRRPAYQSTGPHLFLGTQLPESALPTEQEYDEAIDEERTLLEDNKLIPKRTRSAHRESHSSSVSRRAVLGRRISIPASTNHERSKDHDDEESAVEQDATTAPNETTALLPSSDPNKPANLNQDEQEISQKWEDAVLKGEIQTTWRRESKVLARYTSPLIITFFLQNSLTLTSVVTVGHIGKNELGGISIGTMTANITGYAVYHGLATSLDTLCAQAYGSGKKKLVGLNLQRMVFFLWTCTIPIAAVWLSSTQILKLIVPEKEIAELAGRYLRILILGAPGYALFESSKRYVQAQGKFAATFYVLIIAAPLNVLLHWLFVWVFKWGFIGCPIAVVITENLMPFLLFLYVRFVGGMECWPGFSRKAFTNWGPMVRLALPGFVMVVAEFFAFELLTLAAARISATHLAANTVLQSMTVFLYNFPFPLSIAGSTRVANFIGATLPDAAKVTARVIIVGGTIVGLLNMVLLSSARFYIPRLFTQDEEVIKLAAATLPVNAAFQLFDALAAQCNGILRGLGKQAIGGVISLLAFYGLAIPISFGTAFGLNWKLYGLWAGPAVALFVQASLEGIYIYRTSWLKASEEAAKRNAAG